MAISAIACTESFVARVPAAALEHSKNAGA